MTDIYRDGRGRFAKEHRATFKQSGSRIYVKVFGRWAEMRPVTVEALRERSDQYDAAVRLALAKVTA